MSANSFVPSGAPAHARDGDTSSPSPVYFRGITAPTLNDLVVSLKFIGLAPIGGASVFEVAVSSPVVLIGRCDALCLPQPIVLVSKRQAIANRPTGCLLCIIRISNRVGSHLPPCAPTA